MQNDLLILKDMNYIKSIDNYKPINNISLNGIS